LFKADTNDAGNNSSDGARGCGAGGVLPLAARADPMPASMFKAAVSGPLYSMAEIANLKRILAQV
jgi:hypothetical protein